MREIGCEVSGKLVVSKIYSGKLLKTMEVGDACDS